MDIHCFDIINNRAAKFKNIGKSIMKSAKFTVKWLNMFELAKRTIMAIEDNIRQEKRKIVIVIFIIAEISLQKYRQTIHLT